MTRLSIAALDAADDAGAAAALAPLFEGAPRFLALLAAARPFGTEGALFDRAREICLAMPEDEQVELIDAHPRIGAPPGSVSAQSFREQGYDRERSRGETEAELDRLNAAYEARFGFRFVVFVAGRPRAAIVPVMEERLAGDRETEMRAALRDIVAIAQDRWRKLVLNPEVAR